MCTLHENLMNPDQIYELHNIKIALKHLSVMIVCDALYDLHYDIHAAQSGIASISDSKHMQCVYTHTEKYLNKVKHIYSFIQILIICTAFFAHDINNIRNSVRL